MYIIYVLEESLTKLLQNMAVHIEEHRTTITKLTNENTTSKYEEENFGREIRGTYSHTPNIIYNLLFSYLFAIKLID